MNHSPIQSFVVAVILISMLSNCDRQSVATPPEAPLVVTPIQNEMNSYPILFWEPDPKTQVRDFASLIFYSTSDIASPELISDAQKWVILLSGSAVRFTEQNGKLSHPLQIQTSISTGSFMARIGASRNCTLGKSTVFDPTNEENYPKHLEWVSCLDLFGGTTSGPMSDIIQKCSNLKVLVLPFSGSDFPSQARSLPGSLETLVIYNSNLTPEFLGLFCALPKLKKLVLWGCHLEVRGSRDIFEEAKTARKDPMRFVVEKLPKLPSSLRELVVLNSSSLVPYWLRESDLGKIERLEIGPGSTPLSQILPAGKQKQHFDSIKSLTLWADQQGTRDKAEAKEYSGWIASMGLPKFAIVRVMVVSPLMANETVLPATRGK